MLIRGNPYITHGYRKGFSLREVLRSLFTVHNETANIWSHLVGFSLFALFTGKSIWDLAVSEAHADFTHQVGHEKQKKKTFWKDSCKGNSCCVLLWGHDAFGLLNYFPLDRLRQRSRVCFDCEAWLHWNCSVDFGFLFSLYVQSVLLPPWLGLVLFVCHHWSHGAGHLCELVCNIFQAWISLVSCWSVHFNRLVRRYSPPACLSSVGVG